MADALNVHFLLPVGMRSGGAGLVPGPGGAMDEEGQPAIMWGQGTPDGNLAPFNLVNKGSLYMEVNNTDDQTAVWMRVDEGGESGSGSDWVRVFAENHALIDTNDLSATAAIVTGQIAAGTLTVEDLEVNALSNILVTEQKINISDGAVEYVVFHAVAALTITEIGLLWTEATTGSLPTTGKTTIGVAAAGTEVVASTSYDQSQAIGDYQALAIASGAMAAGKSLFWKHSVQSASAAGECRLVVKYDLDS